MADEQNDENLGSAYMGRPRRPVEQKPKRILPPGLLAGLTLVALAGILWYAYPGSDAKTNPADIPVIKADTGPIKEVPADPGGMEVRHQDSTIFDPLEKKGGGEVEKLLPAPEQPLDKEAALQKTETAPAPEAAATTAPAQQPATAAAPLPPTETPKLNLQTKDTGVEKITPPPAPKKEAAPAAAATTSGGDYELQLGSYRDTDGLKKDWERIKKKYPAQTGKLKMRAVKVDLAGKGTYYRLQAGTLSKEAATAACDAIKAGKGACILVKK